MTAVPLWHEAVGFACRAHAGQLRKDGLTPYVSHVVRVALTVRDLFGCDDEACLAAALLHDVIEDTPADYDDILEAFGPTTADAVAALTKDMRLPEDERERLYDEGLVRADWRAKLIKLADVHDNFHDRKRSLGTSTRRSTWTNADGRWTSPARRMSPTRRCAGGSRQLNG